MWICTSAVHKILCRLTATSGCAFESWNVCKCGRGRAAKPGPDERQEGKWLWYAVQQHSWSAAVPRLKHWTSEFSRSSVLAELKGTETMWNETEYFYLFIHFKHLVTCFPSGWKEVNAGGGQVLVIPGALDVDTLSKRHVGTKAQRKEFASKNTGLHPSFLTPIQMALCCFNNSTWKPELTVLTVKSNLLICTSPLTKGFTPHFHSCYIF